MSEPINQELPKQETIKFTEQFRSIVGKIRQLKVEIGAEAVIIFPEYSIDWMRLRKLFEDDEITVASMKSDILNEAKNNGFNVVHLHFSSSAAINDRISHAILEAVADDLIPRGSRVLVLYSTFDPSTFDSISVINLGEHLERLSGRDLRQLETSVPLKTLKTVVDLAVDIGWEGREGKPVGCLFVVGDTRKVYAMSHSVGFDPVKGYPTKDRNIFDAKVREGIKEVAQLDGAILVRADGIVYSCCRMLQGEKNTTISLSPGLGTRHWAAAAITKVTSAVAIAVSQSSGTVRIFRNGEVALRIEARQRRPLVWKDLEVE
ncbi:MAG: DNA integrity scanning protein DisA nucleotide-binding domain protein [Planctomycetaceae bacterium]|jgi:DNA integrity scanning protein DisA with diadenylate cyclase activity|nr:DNA integrity scanning protein DisA nucleotide-binding domain protein [Planctomycetaceae bacterium]